MTPPVQFMDPLLHPVLAMLLLTMAVFIGMTVTRIRCLKGKVQDMSSVADRYAMAPHLTGAARNSSDNFNNLLEQPVVFYVLCLIIAGSGMTSATYLWLAWAFVVLRLAHSGIHCSYNNMAHRGLVFALASTLLMIMLVLLIIELLPQ